MIAEDIAPRVEEKTSEVQVSMVESEAMLGSAEEFEDVMVEDLVDFVFL